MLNNFLRISLSNHIYFFFFFIFFFFFFFCSFFFFVVFPLHPMGNMVKYWDIRTSNSEIIIIILSFFLKMITYIVQALIKHMVLIKHG